MTVEPQDRIPGQHVPSCRCRTEAHGKRVADWNCLTPDERAVIQALLAGSGKPPISARR
jgi:hypothetical protein